MSNALVEQREEFLRDAQPYRRELLAHCYRMVGSLHEAEDLVQETYLRAWRGWNSFEHRSSVRTWLHRIAVNLCLNSLAHAQRRVLPSGLGPDEQRRSVDSEERAWVEPFPDQPDSSTAHDPAALAASHASVRLALVASLQHLPSRQRAVLLLREVLGYRASEVADLLDMSPVAVKSALQRARTTIAEVAPDLDDMSEPRTPDVQALLGRYIAAFEAADVSALAHLLHEDATIEATPTGLVLSGLEECIAYLAEYELTEPGRYRLFPTVANGQPAAVVYFRSSPAQEHAAFGVVVLRTDGQLLSTISVFADPRLVATFGFPPALIGASRPS